MDNSGINTSTEQDEVIQTQQQEPVTTSEVGINAESQIEGSQYIDELKEMQFLEICKQQTEETRILVANLELERSKVDLERAKVQYLMMMMMQQS